MKVSLIVPVFGVESYIAQCAQSLFSQTYRDIQFVFVNDGTQDRSMEVLSEVMARFPDREVCIINQENAGLPHARAAGTARAEGEYILHVDSDDWIEPDTVEALVDCVEKTGADVVYFDFYMEYPGRTRSKRAGSYAPGDRIAFIQDIFRYKAPGYVWNKFCRRDLFDGLRWPDYPMNEDTVTMAQVLYRSRNIRYLQRFLYHYRRSDRRSLSYQPHAVRDIQAARNFLDFYTRFWDGPEREMVDGVRDDIILRSAWMACRYDLGLFSDYPFLRKEAQQTPLRMHCAFKLRRQILLKCILPFKGR